MIGTGPVSLALRGLLARQGFDESELACDDAPAELPEALARRALALSLGSWQLLSRVADLPAAAPIETVDVSLRDSAGRTRLHAAESRLPALGYVVRYGALQHALRESFRHRAGPAPVDPATHEITIVADGNPGAGSRQRDFDQAALLATVRAARPADGIAFERFTADGPLALLPLPESGHWSLVWCAPPPIAQRRAQLEVAAFERELLESFGPALGALELRDSRELAALQRRLRTRVVHGNEVAIGNAAQALHPVAGQGLNLGLRDAFVLAAQLGDARAAGRPYVSALQAFERARRNDRFATVAVTDTLARIFTIPMLAPAQSLALGLLDIVPPARRSLARAFVFGLRR